MGGYSRECHPFDIVIDESSKTGVPWPEPLAPEKPPDNKILADFKTVRYITPEGVDGRFRG
jgi:hypothetical protein